MNMLLSNETESVVSSYVLWKKLNEFRLEDGAPKIRHDDFIKRVIDECDDLGVCEIFAVPNSGAKLDVYKLNQDQMLLVGMRESKVVRKKVLGWIKSLSSNKPVLPQTFSEALQLAADQAKLIEEAKPKVEFHDTVTQSEHTYKYQEAGKKIQQRPNKFVAWLRENGYIDKQNNPYQRYLDQKLFKFHTGVNEHGHEYTQGRVTTKGLSYFTNKLVGTTL